MKTPIIVQTINCYQYLKMSFWCMTGGVLISGVMISAISEAPMHTFQKYLLILSLDPNTRIATLAFGQQGILSLGADGKVLADKYRDNMLRRALKTYHGDSVDRLAAHLSSLSQ